MRNGPIFLRRKNGNHKLENLENILVLLKQILKYLEKITISSATLLRYLRSNYFSSVITFWG